MVWACLFNVIMFAVNVAYWRGTGSDVGMFCAGMHFSCAVFFATALVVREASDHA